MSTIVTCRNCATTLRVADNVSASDVCPQCFTPLDDSGAAPVGRAPNLVRDVRRDHRATNRGLWLLIVLCIVGILLSYASLFAVKDGGSGVLILLFLMTCFIVLDVLVFVAGLGPLARLIFRGPNATSVGRSLAFAALMLAMAAAIFVFFFAVCGVMVGLVDLRLGG